MSNVNFPEDWRRFSESLKKATVPSEERCYPIIDILPLQEKMKSCKSNIQTKVIGFKSPEARYIQVPPKTPFYPPAYSMLAPMKTHTLDHMRVDLPSDWIEVLQKNSMLSIVIGIKPKNIPILKHLIACANEDLSYLQNLSDDPNRSTKVKYIFSNERKINGIKVTNDSEVVVARVTLGLENEAKHKK